MFRNLFSRKQKPAPPKPEKEAPDAPSPEESGETEDLEDDEPEQETAEGEDAEDLADAEGEAPAEDAEAYREPAPALDVADSVVLDDPQPVALVDLVATPVVLDEPAPAPIAGEGAESEPVVPVDAVDMGGADSAAEDDVATPVPAEEPTRKPGFFRRLVDGLAKTRATLTRQVTSLLSIGRAIDEDLLEELEEVLIQADVGISTTMHLVGRLREGAAGRNLRDAAELQPLLRAEIASIFSGDDTSLDVGSARPFVLLVVGVNGVGKTTTIGKLAARWTGEGKKVLVAAGDTFRAAAIDQLEVWCQRAGADLIRQEQGSDAASVVYDAVHAANARQVDVLIIDTAGRLHTKTNLMQELEKITRVAGREVEGAPHEVLLVLDATTGQNAVEQARQFSRIAPVSGIALTKLDSSAKGGVVIAVRHELDIPVKLIGIGEALDDLRDFDGAAFVEALLTTEDS